MKARPSAETPGRLTIPQQLFDVLQDHPARDVKSGNRPIAGP
jgi:hypothetical protein